MNIVARYNFAHSASEAAVLRSMSTGTMHLICKDGETWVVYTAATPEEIAVANLRRIGVVK